MYGPKLSLLRNVLTLSVIALATGCSNTKTDPTANWSVQKIQTEARDERDAGNYDKAIGLLEKLEGRAAGTPLAQQAQLDRAYAHYRSGEIPQAQAVLDRFIKLHPASSAVDYALYLKGVVNFNDNLGLFGSLSRQDLSERDQQAAKESFESFRDLVARFPDSKYTPDSRLRMTYIANSLAQHEVHVARYYLSRGAYVAAISRAQVAVTEYSNAPAAEEALYLLTRSYDALSMIQLRDDTQRVLLKNYPTSAFLTRGFNAKNEPWWKIW